jgi:rRNA-processing protein EBP2
MGQKSKLLAALDAHKGRDYKLEHQKKLAKKARKRKSQKALVDKPEDAGDNGAPNGTGSEAAEQPDEDLEGQGLDEAPATVRVNY